MKNEFKSKVNQYKNNFNSAIYVKKLISKTSYEIFKNKKEINILIVGSGRGNDFIFLKEYIKKVPNIKFNFILLEINENYLNVSKKLIKFLNFNKNVNFEFISKSFIDKISEFKNKFDIIICSEVIEHIWDFEKEIFFNNFNIYLKKNGFLLLSFPHQSFLKKVYYFNIKLIDRLFKKNLFNRINDDFRTYYSHKGVPSQIEIKSLLIRKNFKFNKYGVTIFPDFFSFSNKNFLFKFFGIFFAKITYFSSELFIIAKKDSELNLNYWYNQIKNKEDLE